MHGNDVVLTVARVQWCACVVSLSSSPFPVFFLYQLLRVTGWAPRTCQPHNVCYERERAVPITQWNNQAVAVQGTHISQDPGLNHTHRKTYPILFSAKLVSGFFMPPSLLELWSDNHSQSQSR